MPRDISRPQISNLELPPHRALFIGDISLKNLVRSDGIDNDCDTFVDGDDLDCASTDGDTDTHTDSETASATDADSDADSDSDSETASAADSDSDADTDLDVSGSKGASGSCGCHTLGVDKETINLLRVILSIVQ